MGPVHLFFVELHKRNSLLGKAENRAGKTGLWATETPGLGQPPPPMTHPGIPRAEERVHPPSHASSEKDKKILLGKDRGQNMTMALGQFPYTEAQNQAGVPTEARLRWVELGSPRGEAERAAQGAQPFFPNWQSGKPCPARCGDPPRPPGNPQKPPATASSMRPRREGARAETLSPRSTRASPSLPGQDPLPPRDQPRCACALAPSRGEAGGGTHCGHVSPRRDRLPGCFSARLSHRRALRGRPTPSRTPQRNLQGSRAPTKACGRGGRGGRGARPSVRMGEGRVPESGEHGEFRTLTPPSCDPCPPEGGLRGHRRSATR